MRSNIEDNARAYAHKVHAFEVYGEHPYIVHPAAVVAVLHDKDAYANVETWAAAWLHDAVENAPVEFRPQRRRDIANLCGTRVLCIVEAVTATKGTRAERMEEELRAIRTFGRDAVAVKLADRIANVAACWMTCDRRLFMYHREWPMFRDLLRRSGEGLTPMWNHLSALMGHRRG
jgi:(p)ppGpp synthase/HD superfamily hydrolase